MHKHNSNQTISVGTAVLTVSDTRASHDESGKAVYTLPGTVNTGKLTYLANMSTFRRGIE